ncbi:MAG: hypothetical protein HY848_17400 [Betaproteobacteria bacterium]|nr:hypothetical protein [Betaproteobacteria bacterium]
MAKPVAIVRDSGRFSFGGAFCGDSRFPDDRGERHVARELRVGGRFQRFTDLEHACQAQPDLGRSVPELYKEVPAQRRLVLGVGSQARARRLRRRRPRTHPLAPVLPGERN